MSLILTIIAFGLMIFFHELGHFLVARAFGVGIETFSLGFGKPIYSVKRGGIDYRINWLPFGGYVRMHGENPDDPDQDLPDSFAAKKWWQRALIAFAGPFANLLLAFLLFCVSFLLPHKLEDQRPVIQTAFGKWETVFQPGDSLAVVNGKAIRGFSEALSELRNTGSNKITLYRNNAPIELDIAASDRDSLIMSLRPIAEPIIGELTPGYPAWSAGLRTGDRVLKVDTLAVSDWYLMREAIISKKGSVKLQIARGDSILERNIPLETNILDDGKTPMIGIMQYQPVQLSYRYPPSQALTNGFSTTVNMVAMNYYGLYRLFQNPQSLRSNIGGPVMIVSMSQSIGAKGIVALLLFFAGISIILMIMNLLPIPILDGGHIMFCLIEAVIGRPVPLKIREITQQIGFALLVMLMVFAFYTDIQKLLLRLISG